MVSYGALHPAVDALLTSWRLGVEQGVSIIARPWPCGTPGFTKHDFRFDYAHGTVTCPGCQTVPMIPGRAAQFPTEACDVCPQRAQCTTANLG
jgi:hypothetical protein